MCLLDQGGGGVTPGYYSIHDFKYAEENCSLVTLGWGYSLRPGFKVFAITCFITVTKQIIPFSFQVSQLWFTSNGHWT